MYVNRCDLAQLRPDHIALKLFLFMLANSVVSKCTSRHSPYCRPLRNEIKISFIETHSPSDFFQVVQLLAFGNKRQVK